MASSTGTVSHTSLYKAWGETRYTSGASPTTYRYTGQREEASFGLYYYNARWYDPALGRFTQADTIVPGGVQGLDRYAYVNNNPLRYTDPSGHWPDWMDNVIDFAFGATYQFANDMTLGAIDAIADDLALCMDCDKSEAYQQGQQAGRVVSNVVAANEIVNGVETTVAAIEALGATLAGGGACAALSGGGCVPVAGGAVMAEAIVIVGGVAVSVHGTAVIAYSQLHHIATDKHTTYWTSKFKELFSKGGLSLQDKANLIELIEHSGRHTDAYHQMVYNRLLKSIKGLTNKEEIAAALRAELQAIADDLFANPGQLRGPSKVAK